MIHPCLITKALYNFALKNFQTAASSLHLSILLQLLLDYLPNPPGSLLKKLQLKNPSKTYINKDESSIGAV